MVKRGSLISLAPWEIGTFEHNTIPKYPIYEIMHKGSGRKTLLESWVNASLDNIPRETYSQAWK
jgi:hypothetical protein